MRQHPRLIRDYRDLVVWQRAMELTEAIYAATQPFPKHEIYGITSQLRRSAISIPSNIAEGNGRRTCKDYVAFLYVARGSLAELRTQVELACRLRYLENSTEIDELSNQVNRMLNGLITSLRRR